MQKEFKNLFCDFTDSELEKCYRSRIRILNKTNEDWGYEDTETEDLSHECFVIAQEYKDIIEEWDQERRKEYERCGDDPMIDFLMEVIPT